MFICLFVEGGKQVQHNLGRLHSNPLIFEEIDPPSRVHGFEVNQGKVHKFNHIHVNRTSHSLELRNFNHVGICNNGLKSMAIPNMGLHNCKKVQFLRDRYNCAMRDQV
jgi:hypothetical protein